MIKVGMYDGTIREYNADEWYHEDDQWVSFNQGEKIVAQVAATRIVYIEDVDA